MNLKIIFLSFLILSIGELYAQSKDFSFNLSAGLSYIPLNELEQSYNKLSSDAIHFELERNLSFIPLFMFGYSPVSNHKITIGIEYLKLQPLVKVIFDKPIQTYMEIPNIKYNIQGIPISFMYEYQLNDYTFSPFVSVGMSYIHADISEEKLYTGRSHVKNEYNGNFYSGNILCGLKSVLNENWQITLFMVYKHSSNLEYKDSYNIKLNELNIYLGIIFRP